MATEVIDVIKKWAHEDGLTLMDVMRKSGVNQNTLYRLSSQARTNKTIKLTTTIKIAKALNKDMNDFKSINLEGN